MIQRIQSVYLALVAIASVVLALAATNGWLGVQLDGRAELVVFAESVLCAFLAIGAMFRFKIVSSSL